MGGKKIAKAKRVNESKRKTTGKIQASSKYHPDYTQASESSSTDVHRRPAGKKATAKQVIRDGKSKRKVSGSGWSRKKTIGYPCVRRRKWGSIVAEVYDPFTERKVWLGTFGTAEEAYEAVVAKKEEIGQRKKTQARMDRTRTGADDGSSGEQTESTGLINSDQVQIDHDGFLLGEYSYLDYSLPIE